MDKNGFVEFMKRNKSERAIARYISYMKIFEDYLSTHKHRKSLEEATSQDLRDFVDWEKQKSRKISQYVWAVRTYYEYKPDKLMFDVARELIGDLYLENYKLKDFNGAKPEFAEKLASKGIKTAKQMLQAGKTKSERKKIAKETGIPIEQILELVKLSNLARIPGVKKIRARLYYDAGLDTLDKIAECKPEEMRVMLKKFIRENNFNGMAPLPKEAALTVSLAKHLERLVEY